MSIREKMRQQNRTNEVAEEEVTPLEAPVIPDEDKVDLTEAQIADLAGTSASKAENAKPEPVIGIDMAIPGADKTVTSEVKRPEIVPGSRESAAGYGSIVAQIVNK